MAVGVEPGVRGRTPFDWNARIAIAAAATAAILLGAFEIVDTDAFWHITNGERILELRTVPRVDEYSHTAAGEPTIYYSWLAEVIAALLIRAGGFELLVLVKALACGLLVAVLAGAARARGAGGLAIAWALLWGLLLVRFRLYARPEIFSLLLLPVVDRLAIAVAGGRRSALLWIALAFVAWANLHPFVIVGIGAMGLHAAGAWLDRRFGRGTADAPALTAAALVAALASLLNPWGVRLYAPALKLIDDSPVARLPTREWLPPTWDGFALFYLLAAGASVAVLARWRRSPTATVALWIAGLALACTAQRNIGIFAVLGTPILASALSALARATAPPLRDTLPSLSRAIGPPVRTATYLIGLALIVAVQLGPYASVLHLDESRHYRFGLGVGPRSAPHDVTDFVAGHGLEGPLYNSWELGGWLIHRFWPQLAVALDGRQMPFERFLGEIERTGLAATLGAHGVRLAIVSYIDEAGIAAVRARPELALVRYDDLAMVFVHRDEIAERRRSGRAIAALDRIRPEDLSLAWLPDDPPARAAAAREVAAGAAPETARAHALTGLIERREGASDTALAALLRAVELDPRQAGYRNNLGVALLDLGQVDRALVELDEAARLDPRSFEALYNRGLAAAALGHERAARHSLERAAARATDPASAARARAALARLEGR